MLESKNFQFGGILTGIALDISQEMPSKPTHSSNLKITSVESEADLQSFTELAADAFAMNSKATKQWLGINDSVMQRGEQIHFLAYLDGLPVGTVTLTISPSLRVFGV